MTQNRPTLTVIGGPHDGETLQIDAPSERLLGSGPTCHLKLDLTNLAPVHARLVWDARGLILSDAGSETGTYVNGERLAGEPFSYELPCVKLKRQKAPDGRYR